MDLKSILKPGDLFVHYWLADRLTIVVGDSEDIQAVDFVEPGELRSLAAAFELQVSSAEYYGNFINARERPAGWPMPDRPPVSLLEVLQSLRSILIPDSLRERCADGDYQRLVVFPDGILHALPIHLLFANETSGHAAAPFSGGAVYAPSASAYAYCCEKRKLDPTQRALVLVGDAADIDLQWEAERVAEEFPCPAEIVTRMPELQQLASECDVVYVATHGRSPTINSSGFPNTQSEAEWELLFDGVRIGPADFFGGGIKLKRGSVVVLSACSAGHLMPGEAHELQGLLRSLFYAGAATVLAARWPIINTTAIPVFIGTLNRVFNNQQTFAAGMNQSLLAASREIELQKLMAGPEASAFFWGSFAVFGCGD